MPRSPSEQALHRHWEAEAREFGLGPWECPPCLAVGDEPPTDCSDVWRASWVRARELRLRLLGANGAHYDDLIVRRKAAR